MKKSLGSQAHPEALQSLVCPVAKRHRRRLLAATDPQGLVRVVLHHFRTDIRTLMRAVAHRRDRGLTAQTESGGLSGGKVYLKGLFLPHFASFENLCGPPLSLRACPTRWYAVRNEEPWGESTFFQNNHLETVFLGQDGAVCRGHGRARSAG